MLCENGNLIKRTVIAIEVPKKQAYQEEQIASLSFALMSF